MELKPLRIGNLTAKVPIIQGGMGVGVSLSRLAGTVASCGGIGVISTAQIGYREEGFEEDPTGTNLKAIASEISKARKLAKGGIIGVNIMVATKHYADYVKAAVKAGADLIISGAGLPTMLPELVKGSSVKIAPIVSTVKSASVILKMWTRKAKRVPDLVVVEGPRAGGHLGFTPRQLEEFTIESYEEEIKGIIRTVDEYAQKYERHIPIVIAGGIYTRKDIDHAISLGADGVQMGTRFVTTVECDASNEYKQTYIKARKEDIVIVKSPVGMPGRAIKNEFLKHPDCGIGLDGKCMQCLERCNPAEIPYCITKALINAAKGDVRHALLFCGDNAYLAEGLVPVSEIFNELTRQP